MRVVRHIRVFPSEEVFWSWLTVLARSAFLDRGRRWTRYLRMLSRFAAHPKETVRPEVDCDLGARLETAMQTLSPEDRALIEQKYSSGKTARELAGERGLSEKATETRLLRIRRRLREKLIELLKHET